MGKVWSVGVFVEDQNYQFGQPLENLSMVLNARKIRTSKRHIHTYADPFLFVSGETLYLFAEIQEIGGEGYINAWKTFDLKSWEEVGCILKENSHCSYPYILQDKETGKTYLIPESSKEKKVYLYEFEHFPNLSGKKSLVLEGNFADSNIFRKDDCYYLATTNLDTNRLELFWSPDLQPLNWNVHPASPISSDKLTNRNGGGFIELNDKLYRVAQNSEKMYGEGIVLLEVTELNKTQYKEEIINNDFRPLSNYSWQKDGRHHLSMVEFQGKKVIVIDGLQNDYFVNKVLSVPFKLSQ